MLRSECQHQTSDTVKLIHQHAPVSTGQYAHSFVIDQRRFHKFPQTPHTLSEIFVNSHAMFTVLTTP